MDSLEKKQIERFCVDAEWRRQVVAGAESDVPESVKRLAVEFQARIKVLGVRGMRELRVLATRHLERRR